MNSSNAMNSDDQKEMLKYGYEKYTKNKAIMATLLWALVALVVVFYTNETNFLFFVAGYIVFPMIQYLAGRYGKWCAHSAIRKRVLKE